MKAYIVLIIGAFMWANLASRADTNSAAVSKAMQTLQDEVLIVDRIWSGEQTGDLREVIQRFARAHPESAGAQTLQIFTALYFDRDWKRAKSLETKVLALATTPERRAKLGAVLHDTCDLETWKAVADDDEKYKQAMLALRSFFKTKFPGSTAALLVEATQVAGD